MKKEYKISLIGAGVTTLCILSLFIGTKIVHYDLDANRLKENELHYWNTKAQLVDEVQSYINQVAPTSDLRAVALVDACEKYNIEVKFALAQGENESHFGTKGLAAKTNSVWNVGAFTDFTYAKIMSTYKYKHPNESIEPYLKLIYNKYMTETAEEGLMRNYVDHNGHRFAADPHYEERLRATYKKIGKCTQIDSLSQQLHYWQVKANR